ncbi:MFS transporter [Paenibacillus physcomitrellae]|uniref:MFS transporter n=1 Tax=Paenibacillus physcomitrellae TaxID=1619311 RepID=A0ABQ1FZT1_9BACL|nr:MFS transporter [Paenibacillus physcomitrellae]GGA33895.1 MFS transporter [Paenibacillus physcomitrellae]
MTAPPPSLPSSSRYNPIWISLSCGLYWFAFSLTRPIISLYAASLGMKGFAVGLVLAIYAFLPLLAAIPGGFIADKLGRTVVLRAGSVLMLTSGLLYFASSWFSWGPWLLGLAQLLAGLGQMAVWLAVQVLITEGPKQSHESQFATFSLYMAIGQMIAPIVSGFLSEHYGYSMVFAGYALSSLLLIGTSWQCKEIDTTSQTGQSKSCSSSEADELLPNIINRQSPSREARLSSSSPLSGVLSKCLSLLQNRHFAVILLTTFISLFIVDVRTAYLPIHLETLSITNTKVGLIVSVGALSALFVRPIYPWLIRKIHFRWLLISTYAVSLLLLFVTPLITNFYLMAGLVFFTGLALGINQPMTLSMIAQSTQSDERGVGIGLRLMSNRAAQLMDPLLFGLFTGFASLRTSFWLVGGVLLLCCLFTIHLYLSTERTPKGRPRPAQVLREKQL